MFKALKHFAIKYSLKKNRRTYTRKKYFFNFNTAKKIGILYPYHVAIDKEVNNLTDYFRARNMSVDVLCYFDEKELPEGFSPMQPAEIFTKREVNWYGRPLNKEAFEFIKNPFDMLIDFTLNDIVVLHYVATLSVAKMKIGRRLYPDNPYDFVLSTGTQVDHHLFVEQLKHYMVTIDMKND